MSLATPSVITPSPLLKKALLADAVVSGAVALLQSTASGGLGGLLALPRALLLESGIFLLAYTVLLLALAFSTRVWSGLVRLIVVGNVVWAIACVAILAFGLVSPNLIGGIFIAVQALTVLIFAALEQAGLKVSAPSIATRAMQR